MTKLVNELRKLAPNRPLSYGESIQVARLQAAKLRKLLHVETSEINLLWLIRQTVVPVRFVPSHELNEDSGLTTDLIDNTLQMFINQGEPSIRQRFSVLHELKHVLDFPRAKTLHSRLGSGDAALKSNMIEWVANEFAAHVLMPTPLVKRIWHRTQDVELAASFFNVSREAMTTRLTKLGLIGETRQLPRTYFRANGLLPSLDIGSTDLSGCPA
jgi:Zn-dependent peptidase ImmA (M78 family)